MPMRLQEIGEAFQHEVAVQRLGERLLVQSLKKLLCGLV